MSVARMWIDFIWELVSKRNLLIELTKRDFISKYLGSYLGVFWAFVHPVVYIFVLFLVFSFVFKTQPINGIPYILWLSAGMIPWIYFSDSVSSATTSIIDNSFLVKKMSFSVGILPLVRLLSAMIIHVFFVLILLFMCVLCKTKITIYSLQIIYYFFSMVVLLVGLSWLTSALIVFLRDVGQLVSIVLQFLFWGTPIFWSLKYLPYKLGIILKLNPLTYIIEGYRDSLLQKVWFWEHFFQTAYFWCFTLGLLLLGAGVFRRTRPHFADVL